MKTLQFFCLLLATAFLTCIVLICVKSMQPEQKELNWRYLEDPLEENDFKTTDQ